MRPEVSHALLSFPFSSLSPQPQSLSLRILRTSWKPLKTIEDNILWKGKQLKKGKTLKEVFLRLTSMTIYGFLSSNVEAEL